MVARKILFYLMFNLISIILFFLYKNVLERGSQLFSGPYKPHIIEYLMKAKPILLTLKFRRILNSLKPTHGPQNKNSTDLYVLI